MAALLLTVLLAATMQTLALTTDTSNLKHVYSKTNPEVQAAAANDVIRRLLPYRFQDFHILVDPTLTDSRYMDAYKVQWDKTTAQIRVTGTTGVAALLGFNQYLKTECKCHIAWEGRQLNLPQVLPQVNLTKRIIDRFRYYQNVCTESYSFVWWDWSKWEEHVDWMALNGINLPLAFTGQETLWIQVYKKLGLSEDDIMDYISGPAFLAWWRMGNIQKWGGPVPKSYLDRTFDLLKRIVQRMRHLGMIPVFPAFAGNIPPALVTLYPNATVEKHTSWNKFNSTYSETYFLLPTDPLFEKIGATFIQELKSVVGTDHVYSCDTFNENRPGSNSTKFLTHMARSTFRSMLKGDSKAVWMIQSWVFTDAEFWRKEQVQAYLTGVEPGNAIVLDLAAEMVPLYIPWQSFFNHSFIWCMLHNFGGTHGLHGSLKAVNEGVEKARKFYGNSTLIGTGICPEGIGQNYVVYDFMAESSLRSATENVTSWLDGYQQRRYGVQNGELTAAWRILGINIYNCPSYIRYHGRAVLVMRPQVNLREKIWYNLNDVRDVVKHFVNTLVTTNDYHQFQPAERRTANHVYNDLFKFDAIDFTRQFLQVLGIKLYRKLMYGYYARNIEVFQEAGSQLVEMLNDMDSLLSTDDRFLLGPWITSSTSFATTPKEKKVLHDNSIYQITLWGPTGEIVDYAAKQWAGEIAAKVASYHRCSATHQGGRDGDG